MTPTLSAFMSYTRYDDEYDQHYLSKLRVELGKAVRYHTGQEMKIFHRDDLPWGAHTLDEIEDTLLEATFYIPVLTPNFFNDNDCRRELEQFLRRQKHPHSEALLLPIYYVECSVLKNEHERAADLLAQAVYPRKYLDWRDLHGKRFDDPAVRQQLKEMAIRIKEEMQRVEQRHLSVVENPDNRKIVLVTMLGEYPVVVSGMINVLASKKIFVNTVQIVYPATWGERLFARGVELVQEYLDRQQIQGESISLPFADATNETNSLIFLDALSHCLLTHQEVRNEVYLSVAGGRKHLSALMSVLPQFYSCVKGLYHLHDTLEHNPRKRYSIDWLDRQDEKERYRRLSAPIERFVLVNLPYTTVAQNQILDQWLEYHRPGDHPMPITSITAAGELDTDWIQPARSTRPLVLIAPLGETPMVVTQAYRLLQGQEQAVIQAIFIVYPAQSAAVRNSAEILQKVCAERSIQLHAHPLQIDDVASNADVETFAQGLEQMIALARETAPDADLAMLLAGGRKGMSALALNAAQRANITRVYHTTIRSREREKEIDEAWDRVRNDPVKRSKLLFLESEQAHPDDCALIKVPVVPLSAG